MGRGPSRRRWGCLSAAALAALLCAGCPADEPRGELALFRLDSERLFELPYPSDLRIGSGGGIDFAHLARVENPTLQLYVDFAASNPYGGFARNGGAFFRFSGPIDPASLPDTPEASLAGGAAVQWLDIDPDSPGYGQRVPLRWRYREQAGKYIGEHSLALLPVAGFPLAPATRHAVVITDALLDADGDAVRAEEGFTATLGDEAAADADPLRRRAHEIHAPLRAAIADLGLSGVVAAAVFTTGRPTELARRAREVVHGRAPPLARELVVAAEHDGFYEVHGVFDAPSFQTGDPPHLTPEEGGVIEIDESGAPLVARDETLRFALSVPKGAPPATGFPVVLYAHGTGGDFRSFVRRGVAAALAGVRDDSGQPVARVAVIGIDQVVHGTRVPPGTPSEVVVFNMTNPGSWVHNLVQGGIDDFSLLRLVNGLAFSTLPWDPASGESGELDFGGEVRFDGQRVGFIGHSQGGITGPVFVGHEPGVRCAVLSGAGGTAAVSFLEQTIPVEVATLARLALGEAIDAFHPVTTLWQQILEQADANNYARLMIAAPPAGAAPKHVFLSEGIVDHYTPLGTTEGLALALGVPLLPPVLREVPTLALRGIAAGALPATGNVDAPGGAVTAGLLQYEAVLLGQSCGDNSDCGAGNYCDDDGQCRDDGHRVLFANSAAVRQYSRFLGTCARDGVPTIVASAP